MIKDLPYFKTTNIIFDRILFLKDSTVKKTNDIFFLVNS